jgi:hypothetical protein
VILSVQFQPMLMHYVRGEGERERLMSTDFSSGDFSFNFSPEDEDVTLKNKIITMCLFDGSASVLWHSMKDIVNVYEKLSNDSCFMFSLLDT